MSTLYDLDTTTKDRTKVFEAGAVPVAVYGLGKMGVPLAAVYADTCSNVMGVDIDSDVVDTIEAGECPISGEPGLPALVEQTVEEGSLSATIDIKAAATDAEIHVAIVPTLLDDEQNPDLSILRSLLNEVGAQLDPGDVVFVESTVPPGACRDEILPLLEEASGLNRGEFGLAFCPERTSSGRAIKDITGAYPKVVGGIDEGSARVAQAVYESINDAGVIRVENATTAEMVKITEGLYRDVNIALVNELASVVDELPVNFREVTSAASTIPFINVHEPGVGVGGHCIPYYPYFVMNWLEGDFPVLRSARARNDKMPEFSIGCLQNQLANTGGSLEGSRVLVLGVAYKPGVAETRATPAEPIINQLVEAGSEVFVTDPVLDNEQTGEFGGEVIPTADILGMDFDAVVIVTAHEEFTEIDWDVFDPMVIINGRQSMSVNVDKHRVYTIGSGLESEGDL